MTGRAVLLIEDGIRRPFCGTDKEEINKLAFNSSAIVCVICILSKVFVFHNWKKSNQLSIVIKHILYKLDTIHICIT